MAQTTRDLDVVLFGATGFVGELTAAHLRDHAPEGLRIALAGRSRAKLDAVADRLGGAATDWERIVVDASDGPAWDELAARTKVVATTVGPYARYGREVVRACAEAGTHYCDLTGEVLFVHRSIAANHETAQRTGACIIHACGFDSVPHDMGVFYTMKHVPEGVPAEAEMGSAEIFGPVAAITEFDTEEEAVALVVNGFCREVLQALPMEFAMEAQQLVAISLEGSVG